jgi:hypothetical protein
MSVQQDPAMAGQRRVGSDDEEEADERKQLPVANLPFIVRLRGVFWPFSLWFAPKVILERKFKKHFIEAVQPCKPTLIPTDSNGSAKERSTIASETDWGSLRDWKLH